MKYSVEITDTFGGQANYSYVEREQLEINESYSQPWIVRQLKAHAGWTGLRCSVCHYGDLIEIRPANQCVVLFAEVTS